MIEFFASKLVKRDKPNPEKININPRLSNESSKFKCLLYVFSYFKNEER